MENKQGTIKYKQGEVIMQQFYDPEIPNIIEQSLIQAGYDLEMEQIFNENNVQVGLKAKIFKSK